MLDSTKPAGPPGESAGSANAVSQVADHPWWIPLAGLVGFAVLGFAWALLPLDEWLEQFSQWINGFGVAGALLFALAYVLGTLLLLPGTPLTIAAGVAFGWWAVLLVFAGGLLSATAAFIIGRYFARDYVLSVAHSRPVMRAAEEAINDEGWKIVALVRLSPVIPFGAQNYLFGTTGVRLATFILVTALAIIPSGLLNVYVGILGREAAEGGSTPLGWIFLGLGIAATIAATILIARKTREKLAHYPIR
jgi:uncharacterized membrane protein YdjX (TVP38/TMEM64 family)